MEQEVFILAIQKHRTDDCTIKDEVAITVFAIFDEALEVMTDYISRTIESGCGYNDIHIDLTHDFIVEWTGFTSEYDLYVTITKEEIVY